MNFPYFVPGQRLTLNSDLKYDNMLPGQWWTSVEQWLNVHSRRNPDKTVKNIFGGSEYNLLQCYFVLRVSNENHPGLNSSLRCEKPDSNRLTYVFSFCK